MNRNPLDRRAFTAGAAAAFASSKYTDRAISMSRKKALLTAAIRAAARLPFQRCRAPTSRPISLSASA